MMNLKLTLAPLLLAALTSLAHAGPNSKTNTPSFADDPAAIEFARDLESRHGFKADELISQFAQTRPNATVLKLIQPPASPLQRSWERYRPRFLNERRIDGGVAFWQENAGQLAKASALYGVPEEIIVAIIGVETEYGRNTGGFRVFEALSTLAFNYPRRAEFFRTELEQFLLLARENNLDPMAVKGSFAGAIGIPQFMPGSQRRYAVDFDGDQRVDLGNSVDDAIGSVARFLEQHGWQAGQPITVPAMTAGTPEAGLIQAGIRPSLKVADLADQGIRANIDPQTTAALIDLVSPGRETEYWLGFENFYVITRYNRSSFYAMSVFQLAEEIRGRMCAATTENRERYCRA
ncbi:lytic murein transglycosylase B [Ferribacterium limneticum]|uniref:lytic murein transglycosylase B n=1 Tax=Ferribacterium limneticum TaxID=76259 RepID=UPI001CFA06F6|nr:lytic murein transglycosylase B [Ferribacterium limneticum]UCV17214.1 lytic murein transglycosylase B [Ferribacterium limneticum]